MRKLLCKLFGCQRPVLLSSGLEVAAAKVRGTVLAEDYYTLTESVSRNAHFYSISITRPGGQSFRVDLESNIKTAVDKILKSYRESL